MAEKRVGIYIGIKSVGVVVSDRKSVSSLATFEFSSIDDEAQVETLQEDIRWEALINKTLREAAADSKNVYISLTDKDFIYRSLEMPAMAKREIESSVLYEIEKYIPFKINELAWDYDYVNISQEKKINLSFVGIKNDDLLRIQNIVARLNLTPVTVEPSSLSLAKILLAQKNYSKLKNFAILDFSDNESYLTFFYQNLPVFNRYLTVTRKEGQIDFDKFIESVRLSFQYFKREFRLYELEKFIVVGSSRNDTLRSFVKEELQVEPEMVTATDLTGNMQASVETVKALGVASAELKGYKFKPTVKTVEAEVLEEGGVAPSVPFNVGKLLLSVGIGAVLSFFVYLVMATQVSVKETQIKNERKELVFPVSISGRSVSDVQATVTLAKEENKAWEELSKSFKPIGGILDEIPMVLPAGAWLEDFTLNISNNGTYDLQMSGNAYLSDSVKERASIDDFISRLTSSAEVKKIFTSIRLISTEAKEERGFKYTSFSIRLD